MITTMNGTNYKQTTMKKMRTMIVLASMALLFSSTSQMYSQEVTIGTQTWSSKNAEITTFQNGDVIPEAKTNDEWTKADADKKPAWCYYNNDPANGKKFGKLYNYYAVNDPRGFAPKGWHVPSFDEWKVLNDFLGGASTDKGGAGDQLKSTSGWVSNSGTITNGTNKSGFNAFPTGYRDYDCEFYSLTYLTCFWTSTEEDEEMGWFKLIGIERDSYQDTHNKRFGLSVRLIKD